MSHFDHRNQAFDYAPPARSGSATGALMFVGGLIALFFLAMLFIGAGDGTTTTGAGAGDAAAPAVGAEPVAPAAPAVPAE